jgi:hypothetical protein
MLTDSVQTQTTPWIAFLTVVDTQALNMLTQVTLLAMVETQALNTAYPAGFACSHTFIGSYMGLPKSVDFYPKREISASKCYKM